MNYQISISQVSTSRNRCFNVFVNGKNIGEVSCNKPSFGADYGADSFINIVFDNAYQMSRRVIIHSFENDVDVFTKGISKIVMPEKIAWAKS